MRAEAEDAKAPNPIDIIIIIAIINKIDLIKKD